jgi:Gpi18-like mannosyltransferase
MVPGVIGMKLVIMAGYIACAYLIGWRTQPSSGAQARGVSPLLALTFFAWNPLIQRQGFGNGHNDMLLLAFMVWGLVLWQRGNWWGAALALTLATTVKTSGLLMLPLFGVALLQRETTWRGRILKGLGAAAIALAVVLALYAMTGPLPDVFQGARAALLNRRGFVPAAVFRVLMREFVPRQWSEPLAREAGRDLFIVYYAFLMLRVWQGRYQRSPRVPPFPAIVSGQRSHLVSDVADPSRRCT